MSAAFCRAASTARLAPSRRQAGGDVKAKTSPSRLDAWGAALDAGRLEHVLLIFLCFAAVIPLLYIARSADGNALTSWRWTFSSARALRILLVLFPAMLAALVASRARARERTLSVLFACAASAAIVPLWTEPEVVLDASRYLVQAKFLEELGIPYFLREWGRGIDAWTDLPLVPFLYGLVFSLAGASRTHAQALDTVLFGATALLVFRIGRMLWGEDTGLHAAILLAGIPFLLIQVPLLLVDVPAMFFLTLSACALLRAARNGGALRMAAGALAVTAAALTKYSLWPMLVAIAPACAIAAGTEQGRAGKRTAAVLLVAGALIAAVIAVRPDLFQRQVRLLATFQWSGLGRWQEGFFSTFLFQTHPFITALALAGVLRAIHSRDRRFLPAAGSLLMAIPLGSTRARYLIPLLPLVALAAAHGLAAVKDRGTRRLVSLCVAATSLVIAYGAYLPFVRGTSLANLARAGEYLDALDDPVVEVHALPQRFSSGSTFAAIPLLGYSTRKKIVCPGEWPVRGEDAVTRTSSMRFSWEMRRPPFYSGGIARPGAPVVVISGEPPAEEPPIPTLRERARFWVSSDVFRYQTFVTVYVRDQGSGS